MKRVTTQTAAPIVREEAPHTINNVDGRMFAATIGGRATARGTFCSQKWSASRYTGANSRMVVKLRFDDECGNGANTFSMTCDIYENGRDVAGGAAHEEIAKVFPELAPLIKWHLCSTDGPHYLSNATYLASDRDHWGKRKGEPTHFEYGVRFNGVPVTHRVSLKLWDFIKERRSSGGEFSVFPIGHKKSPGDTYNFAPKYSLVGYSATKWHECPFDDESEANEFCKALNDCTIEFVKVPSQFSEGKERELDKARSVAIWPEATDEELCSPDLKEKLAARLPALMAEFRKDIEAAGFLWESPAK